MSKILDNRFLKFLCGFIKVLVWAFVILIVAIILIQRLFDNKVSIGSYRMFTIVSGSMLPDYEIYDVVVVKEVNSDEIKVGDDVAYLGNEGSFDGKVVTHRVIKIENTDDGLLYTTRGIANSADDPKINFDQIYGLVVYRPSLLSFLSHVLNNSYGFYFLIFIPISFLIFLEILDHIKSREESD